jgi:hypothetical protein
VAVTYAGDRTPGAMREAGAFASDMQAYGMRGQGVREATSFCTLLEEYAYVRWR